MFSLKAKKTLRTVFITINGIMIENTQWDKVSSHGGQPRGRGLALRPFVTRDPVIKFVVRSFQRNINVFSCHENIDLHQFRTRENPIPRPNIKSHSHSFPWTVERMRGGLRGLTSHHFNNATALLKDEDVVVLTRTCVGWFAEEDED